MRAVSSCSVLSNEVSLVATASPAQPVWLFYPCEKPWAPKTLTTEALPADVRARLVQLERDHAELRVQLYDPRGDASLQGAMILAVAGGGQWTLSPSRLLEPDLETLLEPKTLARDELPTISPTLFVCTHGKRDACCALHGMALTKALRTIEGLRVLDTSHIGGHRFAATLVTFPSGDCYGRVQPYQAGALEEAVARGRRFELAHWRGNVAWTKAEQAAVHFVRAAPELAVPEADRAWARDTRARVEPRTAQDGCVELVRVDTGASVGRFEVRIDESGPVAPKSCGDEPTASARVAVRAAGTHADWTWL